VGVSDEQAAITPGAASMSAARLNHRLVGITVSFVRGIVSVGL